MRILPSVIFWVCFWGLWVSILLVQYKGKELDSHAWTLMSKVYIWTIRTAWLLRKGELDWHAAWAYAGKYYPCQIFWWCFQKSIECTNKHVRIISSFISDTPDKSRKQSRFLKSNVDNNYRFSKMRIMSDLHIILSVKLWLFVTACCNWIYCLMHFLMVSVERPSNNPVSSHNMRMKFVTSSTTNWSYVMTTKISSCLTRCEMINCSFSTFEHDNSKTTKIIK